MTTKTKPATAKPQAKQPGPRPTYRAWLVTDATDPLNGADKALWTELTGLWPTKAGSGLSGPVTKPFPLMSGRLVILPASVRQPDQRA